MESNLYVAHAELEQQHWWFVARRQIIRRIADSIIPGARGLVIDVGCGTGANIASFAGQYDAVGLDTSSLAVDLATRRFPNVRFVCGRDPDDLGDLPGQAAAVLLMDVLEHVPDDFEVLSRWLAAIRPGAHMIMTVPADPLLWSYHDVAYGHYRRYEQDRFERIWAGLPVSVRLVSFFNYRLLPLVKLVRASNRLRKRSAVEEDLRLPAAPVNAVLQRIFVGEQTRLLASIDGRGGPAYRRGVSLIGVIRREAGEIRVRQRPADVQPNQHQPKADPA